MSYLKCNYPGCSNKVRQRTVRFYKFPTKRKSVCDQWILACENKQLFEYHVSQLQNMAICELHFKEEDFKNATHDRLLPNAVPIVCKEENDAVEVTYIHNNRLHTEENREVRVIKNSSAPPQKKTTSLRVQECTFPLIVTKPIRTYENTRKVKPKLELDQDPSQAPVRDPPQEKTQPVLPFLLKTIRHQNYVRVSLQ